MEKLTPEFFFEVEDSEHVLLAPGSRCGHALIRPRPLFSIPCYHFIGSTIDLDGYKMKIGFFQYRPRPSSSQNIDLLCDRLQDVRNALIVLPELFLSGCSGFEPIARDSLLDQLLPLTTLTEVNHLALVGSLAVGDESKTYNRAVFLTAGSLQGTQDKHRLYEDERDVFTPGTDQVQVFRHEGIAFAMRVCLDVIDPTSITATTRNAAIDFLLIPAAVSVDYLLTLARARSLENQIITVFCNRTGVDSDGTVYLGNSTIYYADGTSEHASAEEELRLINIDPELLERQRRQRVALGITGYSS